MNARAKANSLSGIKQSLSQFWAGRNRRERIMLIAAGVAVAVGLVYGLLIDPALSGRSDLEKRLPALRQQAAELQAMAKDASALSGKASTAVTKMTKEGIETSLAKNGLKPQNVAFTGDLAKVQLAGVSFAGLIEWLDEMQRTARISVVDASVEAQTQLDTVNATFTLRQQRSE
ncbi:type II secretion system protein M [Noviherbaspirillum cavernae]|uniref:Type II secretion system protein M n=1 Tax=Noviherbaspirillum cavernae TaxID=2320862 RepID=A0A418X5X0_9BURK|nr:type II secretion system protein GspM [Noviherbaspirillum cavernae]RJG07761.1 type II secretion system protein M [Noviherbaspirillum cavernae]